jgi:uncharacterized damage-inducible protein DinB
MAPDEQLEHLRQRLTTEGEKTVDFFASLAPGAWEQPVYSSGPRWNVRQVLAHFVSAEQGYLRYMRDTLAGGPGVPRDFDIDAFNAAQVEQLSGMTPAHLLEALRIVRRETCAFVAGLQPEDLGRVGYHPWFGDESLAFLIRLIYRHPMLHIRDIRRALESGAPLPDGEGDASSARGQGS